MYKIIGTCIYCYKRENLSDEHIVPEGLGGKDKLIKASCESCRVITSSFEQDLLRSSNWRLSRIAVGIRGKKQAKKDKYISFRGSVYQDGIWIPKDISLPEVRDFFLKGILSTYLFMSIIPPPWILPRNGPLIAMPRHGFVPNEADAEMALNIGDLTLLNGLAIFEFPFEGSSKTSTVRVHSKKPNLIETKNLYRVLAKIAHAFAVQQRGLRSFRPYNLDLIRNGDFLGAQYMIGGEEIYIPPFRDPAIRKGSEFTKLSIRDIEVNGETLVVVRIEIFPFLNPPSYQVVVGEVI